MIESSNAEKCPISRYQLSPNREGSLYSSLSDGLFKIDSNGMITLNFEVLN